MGTDELSANAKAAAHLLNSGQESQDLWGKLSAVTGLPTLMVERIPPHEQASLMKMMMGIASLEPVDMDAMIVGLLHGFTLGHDYVAMFGPLALDPEVTP